MRIASADEFVRLRTGTTPGEQRAAATASADIDVWMEVIQRYPEMKVWVVHNKTVPAEIIGVLAHDASSEVRAAVASLRRLSVGIFVLLAADPDETVRERLVHNQKLPRHVLEGLRDDDSEIVQQAVRRRLALSSRTDSVGNVATKPERIQRLIERMVAGASIPQLESEVRELDIDQVAEGGRTILMVAAAEGLAGMVEVLLRSGASVHATGHRGLGALHEACANGHAVLVDLLVNHGANIEARTADSMTPLMCSAAWGYSEVATRLLDLGADPTQIDNFGVTAADIAREKGEVATAELIDVAIREKLLRDNEHRHC